MEYCQHCEEPIEFDSCDCAATLIMEWYKKIIAQKDQELERYKAAIKAAKAYTESCGTEGDNGDYQFFCELVKALKELEE